MRRIVAAVLFIVSVLAGSAVQTESAGAAGPIGYHGVNPVRLLDTRTGVGAPQAKVGPGASVTLQVSGRGGVPGTGAIAAVLSVTATDPSDAGYITVWPADEGRPDASNLNFAPGQTIPNLVIVKLDASGRVNLFNSAGETHLIADISGWYDSTAQLVPTNPVRLLDTRSGVGGTKGPVTSRIDLAVSGSAGIPAAGVSAAVLNVTVVNPTCSGYLTVWPYGASQPETSSVNVQAGEIRPNLVFARLGDEGKVSLRYSCGRADVLVDSMGYVATAPYMTELLNAVANNNGLFSSWTEGQYPVQGVNRFASIRGNGRFSDGSSNSTAWYTEYNLGRNWASLSTAFSYDDVEAPATSSLRFRVLGDGVELVSRIVNFGDFVPMTVNVSGVLRLRLEVTQNGTAGSSHPVFVDPRLSTSTLTGPPRDPEYFAIQPARLLDTRTGVGAGRQRVAANGSIELDVFGRGGVPSVGVQAVVLNVTATESEGSGYVTVWPGATPQPDASNLNFESNRSVANLVVVSVGANGRIGLSAGNSGTHLLADVLGWYGELVNASQSGAAQGWMTELLDPVDNNNGLFSDWSEGQFPVQGVNRFTSLRGNSGWSPGVVNATPWWTEYNLGRNWKSLSTAFSFDDVRAPTTSSLRFRILGDGVELVSRVVKFGDFVPVNLDVSGVLRLRFEVTPNGTAGGRYPVLVDPQLSR